MMRASVLRGALFAAAVAVLSAPAAAAEAEGGFAEADCADLSFSIDPAIFAFEEQKCGMANDSFQGTNATFEGMSLKRPGGGGMLILRVTPESGALLDLQFEVQRKVSTMLEFMVPREEWDRHFYSPPQRRRGDWGVIELVNAIDDPKTRNCVLFEAYITPKDVGYESAFLGVTCADVAQNVDFEQLVGELEAVDP